MWWDYSDISYAMEWLCAWLLDETNKYSDGLVQKGQTAFDVRNNSQVFYAAKLSIVYAEVMMNRSYLEMYFYLFIFSNLVNHIPCVRKTYSPFGYYPRTGCFNTCFDTLWW